MIDKVEIIVKGGDGGDGVVSFRHEKFVPFGGPNGGDGGGGGSVIVVADPSVNTLRQFRRKRLFKAGDGQSGGGQKKHGKDGKDLKLSVPVGTIVSRQTDTGEEIIVADLMEPYQKVVAARGGRGGWGNTHFVSSTNQVPRLAQKGELGEESETVLELKLIADVGVVGYPNAGKSTLLVAASAARPKIAAYPFTTIEPVLGVAESEGQTFVLAEIPGLIEGAHRGRGLGHDFLRHATRTKVLIHLVDGSAPSPVENMVRVNQELSLFNPELGRRTQIIAVNKIDLPEVRERLMELKQAFKSVGVSPLFISAADGTGVSELLSETAKLLKSLAAQKPEEKVPVKVFRPQPRRVLPAVRREGDVWVLEAPELERVVAASDLTSTEVVRQLKAQFERAGVNRALEKAGAKPGDTVRCGLMEWQW